MYATLDALVNDLDALARDLWWSWQPDAKDLFRDLDPTLWSEVNHNPIALLARLDTDRLAERRSALAVDSRLVHLKRQRDLYRSREGAGGRRSGPLGARPVAYFSAEFGLHESLPIYAGGLGVLAGDHLKAASDLGVPLVGVGLLYAHGYFRQSVDGEGRQQETYGEIGIPQLPLSRATRPDGEILYIEVPTSSGVLHAAVWEVPVGRTRLFLLDADVEANSEADRQLTATLYGGDNETRLRQEILLGQGGLIALEALGIRPGVLHLNEGHSALVTLEDAAMRMDRDGLDVHTALRLTRQRTTFTTHTPVPAGHDRFDAGLVETHLSHLAGRLGLDLQGLMDLGRVQTGNHDETFCMTVLALKCSSRANGVSALHGHVSREMWQGLWPGRPENEVPIGHVTNGVHLGTWLAPQMAGAYERHLPRDWQEQAHLEATWADVENLDPAALWEAHQVMRHRLVEFVRRRTGQPGLLDPAALTLGFARRFATYKRAVLLMQDPDRLAALLGAEGRPLQFVFAGKAHPKDEPGKGFIQAIHQAAKDHRFEGRIVFLEDYDIGVARNLVAGVDGWVNNPRRPMEACGTSGQKVLMNGGLNISILDGWWAEAYDGRTGFAIGDDRAHVDNEVQDARDAESLYQVLENQVVPLFYDRDARGVPQGWVKRMKRALVQHAWRYSAGRMVLDYLDSYYVPAGGGATRG